MNLNSKVGFLLDSGLTPNFISSLNESTINALYERMNKKEVGEQTTQNLQNVTKATKTTDVFTVNPGGTIDVKNAVVSNKDGKTTVEMMEEDELDEKFESKAQQGLFWARCNKCKSEDCKWCKMAKEFSKSTSKKQYKNMPEKKHPKKTIKYKKKKTNEEFTMANYFDKVASVYANNAIGKTIDSQLQKEQLIKKHLGNLIQENLKPTMKKRDLLKLIESEIQRKKGLNEDFYYDEKETELDEDFMMSDVDAPVKTPTRIKPKRETEPSEPEWEPEEDEPIIPSPDTDPEPQAKEDEDFFFKRFKRKFDKDLERMDEATHKPIKYRKF